MLTFLLLLILGYEIGSSDSIEFMPYVLTFQDGSLFSSDLFIQYHIKTPFNERYFFALLTFCLTQGKEWIIFGLHLIVTFFLCAGVAQVTSFFLKDRLASAFVSFLTLLGLTNWNLAASEMYCAVFEGSLIEFSLAIWAVWYMLQGNWWISGLLTAIGVLFQPQIGLNFFILYSISGFGILVLGQNKVSLKSFLYPWIVFCIPIGMYIIAILAGHFLATPPLNHYQYMKIAYEFRLPHHVYPAYFSKWGIILSLIFIPISLFYYFKRSRLIFIFILCLTVGHLIYLTGIYYNSYWIITTWWMRMDAWVRLFGCIALADLALIYFRKVNLITFFNGAILVFVAIACLYKFSATHYDFIPNQTQDFERDICIKAQKVLPKDATCITPFHFTALSYYGKLSAYVNFKAIPKRADYLMTWYSRLHEVYGIDTNLTQKGFLLTSIANKNYADLKEAQINHLAKNGVSHMITYSNTSFPQLKLITSNKEYAIYKLD